MRHIEPVEATEITSIKKTLCGVPNELDERLLHTMRVTEPFVNVRSGVRYDPDRVETNEACDQYSSTVGNENRVIAERLKAHDPQIMDELMLRYQQRLRGYLMHLTADGDLAEDLLQETWMRILTRGSQFKGDSQFTTWLYAIARNLVRDFRRRRLCPGSLEAKSDEGDERIVEVSCQEKNPFEHCADMERACLLADVLGTLLPQHREIVELRFYGQMSLREIAQFTGAPLSVVKAKLYRALIALRPRVKTALSIQPEALPLAS